MIHSGFCYACLIRLMFAEVEDMAKLRIFASCCYWLCFVYCLVVWLHDPFGLEMVCTICESDEVNIAES